MSAAGKMQEPSMDDIIRSIRNIIADDAMAPIPAAKPQPEAKPASAGAPVYRLSEQQIAAPVAPAARSPQPTPAVPVQPVKAASAPQPAAPVAAAAKSAVEPPSLTARIAAASMATAPTPTPPAKPANVPTAKAASPILPMPSVPAQAEVAVSQDDIDAVFGAADDETAIAEYGFAATDFFAADPVAEIVSVEENEQIGRYGANGVDPAAIRDGDAALAETAEATAAVADDVFAVDDIAFGEELEAVPAAGRTEATDGEADALPDAAKVTGAAVASEAPALVVTPILPAAAPAAAAEAAPAPVAARAEAATGSTLAGPEAAPIHQVSAADAMAVTAVASATSKALSGDEGAAAAKPAQPGGQGGRTLEESVREMLRPMIREWLDANLPRILERAIIEEIDKK